MKQEMINKMAEECEDYVYGEYVFDRDKFAELIIKECASVASDFVRGPGGDQGVKRAIQQHFGVEE